MNLDQTITVFSEKMEYLVVPDFLGFQREPCLVSAVGEDVEPLVEGGLLHPNLLLDFTSEITLEDFL